MRIWKWFLRSTSFDRNGTGVARRELCSYCASTLLPCPGCRGDWRALDCGKCALGLRCPTHSTYWLAR